jgi:dTDP-4-dehydrorhamnose 3,5-epimerase
MAFRFSRLRIPDVILIETKNIKDGRGFFKETYKHSEFSANGIPASFVQDNLSHSVRSVIRGLHYQKHPKAQGKLVAVSAGEIFDVAVDIRKGSPTYGQWISQVLSAENGCLLYVPPGFAHGFCALSDAADVLYKVTCEYSPELDRGIIWNDPVVGIEWPISEPSLSPKDARLPLLKDADNNFEFEQML